ncbi:MAG: hypothetical protein AAFP82_00565 [Bacteroidota bacterium]
MQITLNVEDKKAAFFLELIQNFEDFVSIESASALPESSKPLEDQLLEQTNLNQEHKDILKQIMAEDDNLLNRLAQ